MAQNPRCTLCLQFKDVRSVLEIWTGKKILISHFLVMLIDPTLLSLSHADFNSNFRSIPRHCLLFTWIAVFKNTHIVMTIGRLIPWSILLGLVGSLLLWYATILSIWHCPLTFTVDLVDWLLSGARRGPAVMVDVATNDKVRGRRSVLKNYFRNLGAIFKKRGFQGSILKNTACTSSPAREEAGA